MPVMGGIEATIVLKKKIPGSSDRRPDSLHISGGERTRSEFRL